MNDAENGPCSEPQRILGPDSKRRAAGSDGFTLIELLVVVIIIGILAAIAVPVYVNVTNSAKDTALQSDLVNAKTATVHYYHATGAAALPSSLASLKGYGYAPSSYSGGGVAPAFAPGSTITAFCLTGTSNSGTVFSVTSNGVVKKAVCAVDSSTW